MCVVCGCTGTPSLEQRHQDDHAHDHDHDHTHAHAPAATPAGDLHFGLGPAHVSVPGMSQARAVKIESDILSENNRIARRNRFHFAAHGVTALNLVSSPGSGKTTLLCATIEALKAARPELHVAVIEGDQQTSFDADRIRATGAPAIQVNTGKGCHLDAPMVEQAFMQLHDHRHDAAGASASLLFIENVGNLVCPAVWDLGEAAKVAILSVTEGEEKPLKYPDMFAAAQLMVINKIDLLPHVRFDVQRCIEAARRVNPAIEVLQLSATTGEGMNEWLAWLGAATAA
jgi:hydrogenase nickel incorporation protein HypB